MPFRIHELYARAVTILRDKIEENSKSLKFLLMTFICLVIVGWIDIIIRNNKRSVDPTFYMPSWSKCEQIGKYYVNSASKYEDCAVIIGAGITAKLRVPPSEHEFRMAFKSHDKTDEIRPIFKDMRILNKGQKDLTIFMDRGGEMSKLEVGGRDDLTKVAELLNDTKHQLRPKGNEETIGKKGCALLDCNLKWERNYTKNIVIPRRFYHDFDLQVISWSDGPNVLYAFDDGHFAKVFGGYVSMTLDKTLFGHTKPKQVYLTLTNLLDAYITLEIDNCAIIV